MMAMNSLIFNEKKTDGVFFSPNRYSHTPLFQAYVKHQVRNLGVTMDSGSKFNKQVSGLASPDSLFQQF